MKDTMKQAAFDHVDDEGTLILTLDGEQVALNVTDSLERGILSAKQIKSEALGAAVVPEPSTLPISSIQTLVREGHTNAEIAEKYEIAESLVRRFAAPVETEKHYAISQFLSVNAKTGAATRSMEEVISHNLEESGIEPAQVRWAATKEGRQPWKIVARFTRKDQEYKATWMWNLRDNSVVSIDPTAKRLLGENASAGTLLFGEEPANTSSRAIQAALNGRGPIPPAWLNDEKGSQPSSDAEYSAENATSTEPADSSTRTEKSGEDITGASSIHTDSSQKEAASGVAQRSATPDSTASQQSGDTESADSSDKRKPRRSAVPSWDDILFGD